MTSANPADLPTVAIRDADLAEFPPGATYGPCVLTDFELVWLIRGEATWEWDGHHLALPPGQLLLARPGLHSRFVWDRNERTRHAYVHFGITYLPESFGPTARWPLVRSMDQPMDSLCRYLLWLATSGDALETQQRLHEVLALLLNVFVRGPVPPAVSGDADLPDHLLRAARHVRQAWSKSERPLRPVTVTELAEAAGISGGHLTRLFREHFGTGPVATIERLRLARAATMLARSNLTVTAVAAACGFANPYHFSRRFRAIYGHAPRNHRGSAVTTYPKERKLRELARCIMNEYPDM